MFKRFEERGQEIFIGALAAVGAVTVIVGGFSIGDVLGQTRPATIQDTAKKSPNRAEAPKAPSDVTGSIAPRATDFQVTSQLQAAGVRSCLKTADGLARYQMAGVTEYAAASTWNKSDPDRRLVSAIVGQKFGQNPLAPLGVSGVVSSPNAEGKCDGVGLQVIPTSTPCSNVRGDILAKGQLLGTLAGVPMMENSQKMRILLLPSAGNGCVVVGMNNFYAE